MLQSSRLYDVPMYIVPTRHVVLSFSFLSSSTGFFFPRLHIKDFVR